MVEVIPIPDCLVGDYIKGILCLLRVYEMPSADFYNAYILCDKVIGVKSGSTF